MRSHWDQYLELSVLYPGGAANYTIKLGLTLSWPELNKVNKPRSVSSLRFTAAKSHRQ